MTDRADGTLAGALTSGATSLAVAAGQGTRFPSSNFVLWIEDERIHVGTRTGDSFSGLTRGYGGTTPAAHGTGVYCFVCLGEMAYDRVNGNLVNHTHPQADIANLVTDLAGKAAASHTHAASDILSGILATARLGSGTADATRFLRGDQQWAAPGGGTDPWTYVKVTGADFTTTSATAVNVTGLAFTPVAGTTYEFEAVLLLRTATATVSPRPGLAWPTGMTDGVAQILQSQTATGALFVASGNVNAALLVGVGGLPNTTQSWPASLKGMVVAGASPSGDVRVQLASETAGTTVRVVIGSFLRYRTIP